jgi:hypothetical protein
MKKFRILFSMAILATVIFFQSCEKNELDTISDPDNIIPERFKIDIPSSISSNVRTKSANIDTLKGNDVYEHLRNFIRIGEHAADVVNDIMGVIKKYNLSQPLQFSFTSDDDERPKYVSIVENAAFEGQTWEYKMTITDEGTDTAVSNSIALQVFWNKKPIRGIAILNPYNIDRRTDATYAEVMYRVDYSEAGELAFERHMIVALTGFPLGDPVIEPYSVSNLKMFVGKNGDVISVYGNSEHPNARFITDETGFNWAFTAASKESENISVAEVGLPPIKLDTDNRYVLLVDHSIKKVFQNQILSQWPWFPQEVLNTYLYNLQAPGFFDKNGFVQGGKTPSSNYNALLNIVAGLTPYNPKTINQLNIVFD